MTGKAEIYVCTHTSIKAAISGWLRAHAATAKSPQACETAADDAYTTEPISTRQRQSVRGGETAEKADDDGAASSDGPRAKIRRQSAVVADAASNNCGEPQRVKARIRVIRDRPYRRTALDGSPAGLPVGRLPTPSGGGRLLARCASYAPTATLAGETPLRIRNGQGADRCTCGLTDYTPRNRYRRDR